MNLKQAFHLKHEIFTEQAYQDPTLMPDRYVFILTTKCNLNCPYCYQSRDHKDTMTKADWIKVLNQLPRYARVTLTGGEPLVYKDFKDIFAITAGRFDCNIITNGTLLTTDLIDLMLSFTRFKVLSLSIKNEKMMRYFIAQRNKRKSDAILDAKTTVVDDQDLMSIHKEYMDIGVDTHTLQLLKGSPIQHSDTMVAFDDIFKPSKAHVYNEDTKKAIKRLKGQVFMHPKIFINDADHNPKRYKPCKFAFSSVHINSDGEVFPCLAVSWGNVKRRALKRIIQSKQALRFKDTIKKQGTVAACNRCGWLR